MAIISAIILFVISIICYGYSVVNNKKWRLLYTAVNAVVTHSINRSDIRNDSGYTELNYEYNFNDVVHRGNSAKGIICKNYKKGDVIKVFVNTVNPKESISAALYCSCSLSTGLRIASYLCMFICMIILTICLTSR
jgi:hypothetical protein